MLPCSPPSFHIISRRCLVSKAGATVKAEYYTDPAGMGGIVSRDAPHLAPLIELRALCRLIGPLGVKQLNERLLNVVSGYIREFKVWGVARWRPVSGAQPFPVLLTQPIAVKNEILVQLYENTVSAEACADVLKNVNGEGYLHHLPFLPVFTHFLHRYPGTGLFVDRLAAVGAILEFRTYVLDALNSVSRIPVFHVLSSPLPPPPSRCWRTASPLSLAPSRTCTRVWAIARCVGEREKGGRWLTITHLQAVDRLALTAGLTSSIDPDMVAVLSLFRGMH